MKKYIVGLSMLFLAQYVTAKVTLTKMEVQNSIVYDIIAIVDSIAPQDTSYWNCYDLYFHQIQDDIICDASKVCRQDLYVVEEPNSDFFVYVGYCIINGQIALLRGAKTLDYFQKSKNIETITIVNNPNCTFTEYVKPFPVFCIRNNVALRVLWLQAIFDLYHCAEEYVITDNGLNREKILIDKNHNPTSEDEILKSLCSRYGAKPLIWEFEAYHAREEVKNHYLVGNVSKADNLNHSAIILLSEMKWGYFFLDIKMESEYKRYYFTIDTNLSCHLLYRESIITNFPH